MFRNMVTSLFKYDRIRTTDAKAKELRRWADQLITLAKRGDLHARRRVLSVVREKGVVHKLFNEAAERYGSISGGYTRIVKVGKRPGDAAPVSIIELVTPEKDKKKKKTVKSRVDADKKQVSDDKVASSKEEDKQDKKKVEEQWASTSSTAGEGPDDKAALSVESKKTELEDSSKDGEQEK
jgi:large subunit ribosomal protein L17